jgi:hypothetical protein
MATNAVVIGSYCSDFEVSTPLSATQFCFYRGSLDGGSTYYYITSNVAMRNVAAGSTNTDQMDDIKIIPSTFYKPSNGDVTDPTTPDIETSFQQMKFKPIWNPTMSGDFSTPVIAADDRRFLSSSLHPTFSTTEANRFVKLNTKNNNTVGLKFSGTAVIDATACQKFRPQTGTTSSQTPQLLSDANIKDLVFSATEFSPIMSTSSTTGFYIVVKEDWDNRASVAVTASKRLRYLVYDPATSVQKFRLVDLYDPDISESTIKSCFYRLTNGTSVTLTKSSGDTVTDSTTFSGITRATNWGIKGHIAVTGATTRTGSFVSAPAVNIPGTLNSISDPVATDATTLDLNSKFFMSSVGSTNTSEFTGATLTTAGYSSEIIGASYTLPTNFEYFDHTNGFDVTANLPITSVTSGSSLQVTFVTQIFDKRVEELFTNVNVTLLRLVQPSSGVSVVSAAAAAGTLEFAAREALTQVNRQIAGAESAAATIASNILNTLVSTASAVASGGTATNITDLNNAITAVEANTAAAQFLNTRNPAAISTYKTAATSSSTAGANENNYLGLEHVVPTNSVTPDNGTMTAGDVFTPSAAASGGIGLIVRDYFKFHNPARATQFKFYDLGNNSEYIWQANFQSGATNANAYAYITVDGNSRIQYKTKISDQNQRGWILEYDNTMSPPAVRLKWAATGVYLDVAKHGVTTPTGNDLIFGTDAAPLKADGLQFTNSRSSAAIFNCIVCSSIDATGACRIPSTIDTMQGSPAPGGAGGRLRTSPVGAQVSISSPISPGLALIADSTPFRLRAGTNYIKYALSQFSSPTAAVMASSPADTSPSPTPSDPYISEFILTQQGGVMSDNTRGKRGFFIKASTTLGNYYLRVDPNTLSIRMVATNLPSDTEGYAWILINNNNTPAGTNKFNLVSVPITAPASISTSGRYVNISGSIPILALSAPAVQTEQGAIFTYENTGFPGVSSPVPSEFSRFSNTTAGWAPASL